MTDRLVGLGILPGPSPGKAQVVKDAVRRASRRQPGGHVDVEERTKIGARTLHE